MARLFRIPLLLTAWASLLNAATQWVKVSTPNFELYTSAGEKAGRDTATHFEQVRAFFAQASPVKPPSEFPLRIIVFANPEQFAPYSPLPGAGAYFVSGPGRDYIVMRDATTESYSFAVHEYMHFVTSHSGLKLPVWLNEGWADVYSSMRRVRDGMAVGDLVPMRMKALETAKASWLDLPTLLAVDQHSPIDHEGDRTGLFYAESWALTHMLFLSPGYKDNFGKFLMAVHRGTNPAEAFETSFGKTTQQVDADLRSYFDRKKIQGTVFQPSPGKTSLGKTEPAPVSAQLEDFNSRLLLADLRAATGRGDLARSEYETLETQQPDNQDLQQSMGYFFWGLRDNKQSLEHLEKAFAAGADNAQMCYTLGLLQLAAGRPLEQIAASHERAVKSRPGYAEALIQLGLIRTMTRQFPKVIDALMAVPNVTPDKAGPLFESLAYAWLETGDIDNARLHLNTARKYANKPEIVKGLDTLSSLIEARAKSQYAPRPGEKLIRAEGMVQGIDCSQPARKMVLTTTSGQTIAIELPTPAAVEFMHQGTEALQIKCGPVKPFRAVVEYGQASALRQGTVGVLRTLQY
ncbi:MAG TPA: hypothetical protein VNH18_27660 [Bryobacteraceae bacterium]|nr:hypothetical protein [Bryobacteraceae bacterium]